MTTINIHSTVNLITNSSTVIFTYQQNSLNELKNLVNEMIRVFDPNSEMTFDDLFYANVFADVDTYSNFLDNTDVHSEFANLTHKEIENSIQQVLTNEIEKPKWMIDAEHERDLKDTTLDLKPKDEKHQELANRLLRYLNSADHESSYEG